MTAFNKNDWPFDINFMHQKFGVHEWIEKNKDNKELLKQLDYSKEFSISHSQRPGADLT